MKIEAISAAELTPQQVATWAYFQDADPALDSPYFRPEFTQAVAAVRDDVEVALIEDGNDLVGFFPFQRGRGNVAVPVGGMMSDFHGAIMRARVPWTARQLLRGCGLAAWHFDHLVALQQPLQPYHWATAASPYIDVSEGWDAYQNAQQVNHRETFRKIFQKHRRCEREVGPVRLEYHTDDAEVFDTMVAWKREQYRRTGVADVLASDWTTALLGQILRRQSRDFSGVLTSLYLGDTLSAVLLSMRSGNVLHAWFSAHGPHHSHVSPGLLMWMELIRTAAEKGVSRIDLGKGREAYKKHLMSGAIKVAEGAIQLRPLSGIVRKGWLHTCDWLRRSPLRKPLLRPARLIRRMAHSRRLRR